MHFVFQPCCSLLMATFLHKAATGSIISVLLYIVSFIPFAILVEGQLDVIACHESDIGSAIATLGTACTPEHARLLKRYTSSSR